MNADLWEIRHAGSNESSRQTMARIIQGIADGIWDTADEVKGPREADWSPIEAHPAFEEVLLAMEEPPEPKEPESSHLDMNPMIDVALVLLIFFILTTTAERIRRIIETPIVDISEKNDIPPVKGSEIPQLFLTVSGKTKGDEIIITIEGKDVVLKRKNLEAKDRIANQLKPKMEEAIRTFQARTKKNRIPEMLYDIDGEVPHKVQLAILDAGRLVGITTAHQRVNKAPDAPK